MIVGSARQNLMCHVGFQQLYREKAERFVSPKDKIYEILKEYEAKLDKVTVVGHSLGGGNRALLLLLLLVVSSYITYVCIYFVCV